jgi:hypothetical protein
MPSDITGTEILDEDPAQQEKEISGLYPDQFLQTLFLQMK